MKPRFLILLAIILTAEGSNAQAGYPIYYRYSHGYYCNGCYYPKPQYAAPPAPSDPNWRQKLLDVIAYNKKIDAEMADWEKGMEALTGSVGHSKPLLSAQQGSTLYTEYKRGFELEPQNLEDYIQENLATAINGYDRATERAQIHGDKAHDRLNNTVQRLVDGAERVQIGKLKLEALKAFDTPESKKQIFGSAVTNSTTVTKSQESVTSDSQPTAGNLLQIISNRCVSCHSASNPQGNIDMTKYIGFSSELKDKIREIIDSDDPQVRMPKKKEGNSYVPGEKLPLRERAAF